MRAGQASQRGGSAAPRHPDAGRKSSRPPNGAVPRRTHPSAFCLLPSAFSPLPSALSALLPSALRPLPSAFCLLPLRSGVPIALVCCYMARLTLPLAAVLLLAPVAAEATIARAV